MEGIPGYTNALEDAQKQSNRAANPITATTLLLILNNAMLSTEHYPLAEEIWGELSKDKKDWAAWKNLYKAADQKSTVKNQAA